MKAHGLTYILALSTLLTSACPAGGGSDEAEAGTDSTSDASSTDASSTDASSSETSSSDASSSDSSSSDSSSSDSTSDSSSTDASSTDASSTDSTSDTGTETTGGLCDGATVLVCETEPLGDGFTVEAIAIEGDCLQLDVSYGGGCAMHAFTSCWDQSFAESDPVQATLWIDHDAMNDPCDSIVQDSWIIDLTEIKESWQLAYQSQTGTIILHVAGESIQYDF